MLVYNVVLQDGRLPVVSRYFTVKETEVQRVYMGIDEFRKWAWRNITSLIYHALKINVGQKHKEIQWREADLQGFLYTALLYQAMTNRNINAATSL